MDRTRKSGSASVVNQQEGCRRKMGPRDDPGSEGNTQIYQYIQSRILLPILASIRGRLSVGHPVIFSGILAREEKDFCAELSRHGFDLVEVLAKNVWVGIIARRGS